MTAVGIDVGARRFHVALLETLEVVATGDVDEVVGLCRGATAIAIDAPAEPASGRVHSGARSAKFAAARCNEIAAGEDLGVWVPWVTPVRAECPTWMEAGFVVWDALRAAGHQPIEVYPAGCFWLLNVRRWPPRKSTQDGRAARAALLGLPVESRSHDELDALIAARVASGPSFAVAHEGDACDDSAIWFPAVD